MPTAVICVVILIFVFRFVKYTQDIRKAKAQPPQEGHAALSEKDLHKMSGGKPGGVKVNPDELEHILARRAEEKAAEMEVKTPAVPEKVTPAPEETLARRVVGYYVGMWNPTDGTLFTDPAMTIDRFAFSLDADHLTDTVWLEGSTQPLTSDAAYSSLPGQSDALQLDVAQQPALYEMVKGALLKLGTVTEKNDVFYPVHPKSADASDAKAKADLQAQMEELLRQRKQSKPSESLA